MQSKENAWTYLALKQAKEMALQLLHSVAGYWFWRKKNNGHAGFGLFSLLLPVFFSSLSLLLCSAFFFLFFSFHSREQKLLFSVFYLHVFGCFFCSFLSVFLFFLCSFFLPPLGH
jgi:hypothetical protein